MYRHIKRHKIRKKRKRINTILIFSILLFITLFVMLDIYIRPIVNATAVSKAKVICTNSINTAITDELISDNISYDDLITINKKDNSTISSIETNTQNVNLLKSKISVAVENSLLNNISNKQVYIPLGTLIGSTLLAGKGPNIPINIASTGSIVTDFNSTFTSAGVNQTRHQIYVTITASVSVLLPFSNTTTEISTSMPVAETIIVGEVPQFYASIDGCSGTVNN